jgi:hypothetical protein
MYQTRRSMLVCNSSVRAFNAVAAFRHSESSGMDVSGCNRLAYLFRAYLEEAMAGKTSTKNGPDCSKCVG